MENLFEAIGRPTGLVIHTDAGKGLETAVDNIFVGVEHRECMRHLAANFSKKFKGLVFEKNLWPAALTYLPVRHAAYMEKLCANKKVKPYLEEHHSKLWSRSKFGEVLKVDYVNNNLAESFNSKIKKLKDLAIVDMLDAIRQCIMEKIDLRQRIAAKKFEGHKIILSVIKALNEKSKRLKMRLKRSSSYKSEVFLLTRRGSNGGTRGPRSEIECYVDDYYSVEKFKAAYAQNIPPMVGKNLWPKVNPGFKLQPPVLRRPPGRPQKNIIKASYESAPRLGLGGRKRKCKRCGKPGHMQKSCKEPVDPVFSDDEVADVDSDAASIDASTASSRKGGKQLGGKKRKKPATSSRVKTTCSNQPATTSQSHEATSPAPRRGTSVPTDSPAANTRSKSPSGSPSPNTRSKKRLKL